MPYELRSHTADVAVAATGASVGDTFAAVADGMAAAMCEDVPEGGQRHDVAVASEGRKQVLFDYLDQLIYERDVEAVLPVENRGTVRENGDWQFTGSYRGVPLERVTARDLKAVTYSEMQIERTSDGWSAYVVFDV